MQTLEQSEIKEFLSRFYSFNDAVLRKIEISYAKDGSRSVSICVASRDAEEVKNKGWACVRLTVSKVQDYSFCDAEKTTAQVLSQGIHICCFGEVMGLDIGYFVDGPESLDELKTSSFFVTGSSIVWSVEPY